MTAAKVLDGISRLPDCSGEASDAVSAYTQEKWRTLQIYCDWPNQKVQQFEYIYHVLDVQNHGELLKKNRAIVQSIHSLS